MRTAVAALGSVLVVAWSPAVMAVSCQVVLDGVEGDFDVHVAVGALSSGFRVSGGSLEHP